MRSVNRPKMFSASGSEQPLQLVIERYVSGRQDRAGPSFSTHVLRFDETLEVPPLMIYPASSHVANTRTYDAPPLDKGVLLARYHHHRMAELFKSVSCGSHNPELSAQSPNECRRAHLRFEVLAGSLVTTSAKSAFSARHGFAMKEQ